MLSINGASEYQVDEITSRTTKITLDFDNTDDLKELKIFVSSGESSEKLYDTIKFLNSTTGTLCYFELFFVRIDKGIPERAEQLSDGSCFVPPYINRVIYNITGLLPETEYTIKIEIIGINGPVKTVMLKIKTLAERPVLPEDRTAVYYIIATIIVVFLVLLLILSKFDVKKNRTGYFYIAPALLALIILTFYPLLYGFYLSFTNYSQSYTERYDFVGLENYYNVFTTPELSYVFATTILWTAGSVIAHVLIGLALAILLNHPRTKGKPLFRALLLLPWAMPAYISILIWKSMFQYDGAINQLFFLNIDYLHTMPNALAVVLLVNIWLGFSFMIVVFSGALQAIPKELYEAAEIDGLSRWKKFTKITFPMIKSTMVPATLLGIIWTFNMFNVIYLLTGGGPPSPETSAGSTDILITFVYDQAFQYWQMGFAAAYATVIFMILLSISIIYLRIQGSVNHEPEPKLKTISRWGSFIRTFSFDTISKFRILCYVSAGIYMLRGLHIAFERTSFGTDSEVYNLTIGLLLLFFALGSFSRNDMFRIALIYTAFFDIVANIFILKNGYFNVLVIVEIFIIIFAFNSKLKESFSESQYIKNIYSALLEFFSKHGNFAAFSISKKTERLIIHAILIIVSVITIIPLLGVVISSFNPMNKPISFSFPQTLTFDNYERVLFHEPFIIYLRNSLIAAIGTTLFGFFLSATCAYAFSRFELIGKKPFMFVFLIVQMFPGIVILIPYSIVMRQLGLVNTFTGLIFSYAVTVLPLNVWMLKGYFDTIPKELEEAAYIDGCSRFQAFYRIILPLSKPVIMVIVLFSFLASWNEFLLAYTQTIIRYRWH